MMMEHGGVRNLEQIQENDGDRTPKGVTLLLVALGGACIVFAALAIAGRRASPVSVKADPLGELVVAQAKAGQAAAPKATDLSARDVTFPGILSDEGAPTTALAAVKGGPSKGLPGVADTAAAISFTTRQAEPGPSGASEKLPIVPLPAQNMLGASPVVTRPRDALTRAASDAAEGASNGGPPASAGHEGGYQLQVSSFRTQAEADAFAGQLRTRGHKAYVVEAKVPGRGTWFRVRVGPFPSQHAAASYRAGFEGREHVVPFIVPPAK
jgi:cell division septation protein DedD